MRGYRSLTSTRLSLIGGLVPLVMLCLALASPVVSAQSDADRLPSLNPMLERVMPGVVSISVRGTVERAFDPFRDDPNLRRFFGLDEKPQAQPFEAAGSGVIIDADKGLIVTNHHVIANADTIYITLRDRRRLEATVVGSDPQTDIALLRVETEDLHEVPLGDSDSLRVGDFVVAIGNPFALGQTATIGIVSATGRTGIGTGGYEDFIQTDASINPGNSGGALVTQSGELVGINTAILSRSGGNIGIGFAVPSNMVRQVVAEIERYGEVRRGRLGVYVQDLTPELAEAMGIEVREGAVVTRTIPRTAAAEAGLQAGDVILSVNGHAVRGSADLRNRIGAMDPGDEVEITLIREGDEMTVSATLERQETEKAAGERQQERAPSALTGVTLGTLTQEHPLHGEVAGVLVKSVEADSRAARAGLRPGDVIVSANRQPVSTPEDLRGVVSAADAGAPLLLNVRRGRGAYFIAIR